MRACFSCPSIRTRCGRLLPTFGSPPSYAGFRGQPPADIDAVVDTTCRLGALALEEGARIAEIDINPLMVYPAPHGVIIADALIRLRAPLKEAHERGSGDE
jgi:ATP-grasp domain